MRHIRIVLGVLLLIASIGGVFLWETVGRSKLMMEEVIAAGRDIRAGAVIEENMLSVIEIPKGSRIKKGFSAGEWEAVVGKKAALPISGKQQISADFFLDEVSELAENEAFFKIPASWIAMRSSSLRRGDQVEIFGDSIDDSFGVYRLAFVKNVNENEVRDVSIKGDPLAEPESINKRLDSDSVIDHVEIVATPEVYYRLRAYVEGKAEATLVLVRRDKGINKEKPLSRKASAKGDQYDTSGSSDLGSAGEEGAMDDSGGNDLAGSTSGGGIDGLGGVTTGSGVNGLGGVTTGSGVNGRSISPNDNSDSEQTMNYTSRSGIEAMTAQ